MHEELWQKFESLDQQDALQRAKCNPMTGTENYTVTMLNKPYTIALQERKLYSVYTESEQVEAGYLEQLCILAYLIQSKDIPLANRHVKPESLPGGQFFFRGHHSMPTDKLEKVFGENPETLYQASHSVGAKKCEFGDASVELLLLPRIPVVFIVWGADEDFNARASILFDSSASEQMPLDALHVAVNLAVKVLAAGCS